MDYQKGIIILTDKGKEELKTPKNLKMEERSLLVMVDCSSTGEQLLEKAWGPNYIGDKSFVKLYIRYLRQKIEENPHTPRLILTERGVGYYFAQASEEVGAIGS